MLADRIGFTQLRELAAHSRQIVEELGSGQLKRASEYAGRSADSSARLAVQLRVLQGAYGFPEVAFSVAGNLELQCQRCLETLWWPVELDARLVVVESEADLENVGSPFDTVVVGELGICLAEVIEDEVIASLPLAPMHEPDAGCTVLENPLAGSISFVDGGPSGNAAGGHPEAKMNFPFAKLADLVQASPSRVEAEAKVEAKGSSNKN